MRKRLFVSFFKNDSSKRSYIHNFRLKIEVLIAYFTISSDIYTHVEISLSDEEGKNPVTYTCNENGIFTDFREFNSNEYSRPYSFILNDKQYNHIQKFLQMQINKPFNTMGYYFNFIPIINQCFYIDCKGKSYFCSEFVTTVLLEIGAVCDLIPCKTLTNDLYKIISESDHFNEELNMKAIFSLINFNHEYIDMSYTNDDDDD